MVSYTPWGRGGVQQSAILLFAKEGGIPLKKRRRCLGVVIRSVDIEYANDVLEGISAEAYDLGYNVAVFAMFDEDFSNSAEVTDFYRGEKNIYNLINVDLVEGFIFPAEIYHTIELRDFMFDFLKKTGKPVVTVDYENDIFPGVLKDERSTFKLMVEHMINVHGYKKVACLTGIKDTFQAEERLAAYKEVMAEHGLEVKPEWCIYGDYWCAAAYELAEKYMSGELGVPDALVCANDRMAMFFIEKLQQNGYEVPNFIAVAGYDGISESRETSPTICTCKVPDSQSGANAVAKLHEILTAEKVTPVKLDEGFVVRGESCGCNEEGSVKIIKIRNRIKREQQCEEYYRTTNLFERLATVATFKEMVNIMYKYIYVFSGGEVLDFSLCMCKNWDALESETNYVIDGYTKKMIRTTHYEELHENRESEFNSNIMFPELWEETEKPQTFMFFPVHFNERCLGYSVVRYDGIGNVCGKTFWDWHKALANALEFRREKICLESLNQITYLNSLKDKLTGIYNRSGYDRYSEEFMQNAKSQGKKFLLISCDMDGLKFVNDTYGHFEGDIALRTVANGLSYVCLNNEISARVGGDEFVIIGWGDYSEQRVLEMIAQFEQYLARFNAASSKPYRVDASTGYVICEVNEETDKKALYEQADKMMYAKKFAKPNRKVRR